jgi:DnaJ-class molecular chaperone
MVSKSRLVPSNLNQCPRCDGTGILIRHVPGDRHTGGLATKAYTCENCLGTGRTPPPAPVRPEDKQ